VFWEGVDVTNHAIVDCLVDGILPAAIEKLHADERYKNAVEHAAGFPTAMDVSARLMFQIVVPMVEKAVLEAAAKRVMALPDSPIFANGGTAAGIIQVAEARDAVLKGTTGL